MRKLLLLTLLTSGCATQSGATGEVRLPAAKPDAVEALKDAARSVRLGPANYERAIEKLKQAQQLDPNLWEAFFDEGWLALKLHDPRAAIAPLEKAQSINPGNSSITETLGDAYSQAGRHSDAAGLFRKWLERPNAGKYTRTEAIRVSLGAALRRAGKLDEAIQALQRALAVTPRSQAAMNELGLVYQAQGKLELAELVLRRALEVDDKSKAAALTWNNLGLNALERRRDQEAFADFDQAAKLDPSLSVARRNKAVVWLDCGDYAKAAEELRHVTRNDPDDEEAWIALGVAERGRGNHDAAARAYQKALEIAPEQPDALYDLGVLEMDYRRDNGKAKQWLEQFVKAAPSGHPKQADVKERLGRLSKPNS